jgi:hypothetical protein
MDFVGGFSMSLKGCEYLFVMVDYFNKMCVLILCEKMISRREVSKLFKNAFGR